MKVARSFILAIVDINGIPTIRPDIERLISTTRMKRNNISVFGKEQHDETWRSCSTERVPSGLHTTWSFGILRTI